MRLLSWASQALRLRRTSRRKAPVKRAKIKIQLVKAGIEKVCAGKPKVDAVAVGHYIGVAPQNAELALDRAISKPERMTARSCSSLRCIVVAPFPSLGQNMQLVDTRDPSRVIVLAGMGQPGGFRQAELTVLARELVWMLGRSARQHLQTVLIGSGAGNLPVADACARGFEASAERCMMPHPCTSRLSKSSPLSIFPRQIFCSFTVRWSKRRQFLLRTPKCWRSITPNRGSREYGESRRIGASREKAVRELRKALESGAPDCRVEPIRLTVRLQEDSLNSPLSLRMLQCPSGSAESIHS